MMKGEEKERTVKMNCDEGRGGKQRGVDEELAMRGKRWGGEGGLDGEEREGWKQGKEGEEERDTDIPHTHGKPLTSNNKFEPLYPS